MGHRSANFAAYCQVTVPQKSTPFLDRALPLVVAPLWRFNFDSDFDSEMSSLECMSIVVSSTYDCRM